VAVAYCIGTLDRLAVEDLSERVRALVYDGVWGFVCSLERVNHIHFQALQGLIALHQMVREAGGRMLLSDASPYLRQILEFGGVPARVSVMPEKNGAVDELLGNQVPDCSVAPLPGVQQTFF
jgi:anti-anti-sigma regulatory factor